MGVWQGIDSGLAKILLEETQKVFEILMDWLFPADCR
jgi:hypothetical protein